MRKQRPKMGAVTIAHGEKIGMIDFPSIHAAWGFLCEHTGLDMFSAYCRGYRVGTRGSLTLQIVFDDYGI
jgi:hypothetical protein